MYGIYQFTWSPMYPWCTEYRIIRRGDFCIKFKVVHVHIHVIRCTHVHCTCTCIPVLYACVNVYFLFCQGKSILRTTSTQDILHKLHVHVHVAILPVSFCSLSNKFVRFSPSVEKTFTLILAVYSHNGTKPTSIAQKACILMYSYYLVPSLGFSINQILDDAISNA